VYGTAAGAVVTDPPFSGTYFGTEGAIAGLTVNGEPLADADGSLPHVEGVHREMPEEHVFEDIMQLVDWIADGTPSIVTAEHARHVIDIIESAYRSAETGRVQDLHTTFARESLRSDVTG
jgi:predicted dehydrogenase